MKANFSLLLFVLFLQHSAQSQNLSFSWAANFGSPGFDYVTDLARDPQGNLFISGYFDGTINPGNTGPLVSAGNTDALLIKLSPSGTVLWAKRGGAAGSQSTDRGNCVAVSRSGRSYLAGVYFGSANFGGSPLPAYGNADGFVAAYAPDGQLAWSIRLGGPQGDLPNDILVDNKGDVWVTGTFSGTANFGGSSQISAGNSDAFLLQLDSNGVFKSVRRFGGTASDNGTCLSSDSVGNVYLAGTFRNSVSFGSFNLQSRGQVSDGFLLIMTPAGTIRWANSFGSRITDDTPKEMVTSPQGVVTVTGEFTDTLLAGTNQLICSPVSADSYFLQYDSTGLLRFARQTRGQGNETIEALITLPQNRVAFAGHSTDTVKIGAFSLVGGRFGMNFRDAFMGIWDGNGNCTQLGGYGGSHNDSPQGLAWIPGSSPERFVITAMQNSTLVLPPLASYQGGSDIFVGQFNFLTTSASELEVVNPKLQVYPNPALGSQYLNIKSSFRVQDVHFVDAKGKILPATILNDSQILISHLPPGLYRIVINGENDQQTVSWLKNP